ncbi:GumC family protein [Solitalea lacus]|uniref:GumC family protein n=1 Tax=Solitalea lacus TaxID=2911172 RepID=UPI001EDA8072|nr:tyrosine-protein kinase family protein [Solitalea lacus]UKJ07079.1 polysaccharide biosynthesis tyrosine autokinase [Solitalea lacus]
MNNQIDPFFFQQEEQQDFNLKTLIFKYLAYWKWFVASIVVAIIAAFIFLSYQTPQYLVKNSILIKDEKKGLGQDAMLKELDIFTSNKVVENEIEIIRSYTLLENVVKNLNLNISYIVREGIRHRDLYKESPVKLQLINPLETIYDQPLELVLKDNGQAELNGKTISLNKVTQTPYGTLLFIRTGLNKDIKQLHIVLQPITAVAEAYQAQLNVETTNKMASVLVLSLITNVPQKGKDFLNNLIEEYNKAAINDKNKVAAITLEFIEERLKLIAGDLSTVERNVEDFKSREGITDISAESKLFLESIKENDTKLNEVKIQQSVLNDIEKYVRAKNNSNGTVPATLGISDPTLLSLIKSLSDLELKRASSIKVVRADNPIISALDDQIVGLKQNILDNIQTLKSSIATTRYKLENENSRMETMIRTVPRKERELVDISRQQAIKNNLYLFLLQKREETALSYASAVPDSRIIDSARSSSGPVKPVKRNIIVLFGLLGLAVPFGIIYLIELLNDKITKRTDIEERTKAPILAEISYDQHDEVLVVSKKGRSVLAEQVRALRTNLQFLVPGCKLKTLLFTSSISGEGKSFISLNLGASLAMTGKKTIILELDLRKPKLQKYLELSNPRGISNYLIGQFDLNELISKVPGQDNYYIMTTGPLPPNPAELLISARFEELMNTLKDRFDYIIIDAPPVGLVTDAQIMEPFVDATLFVTRHQYTPKERIKMVDALYKEKRFKNLHLIFNGIKDGGQYGYGYGYGYGYYAEQESQQKVFH